MSLKGIFTHIVFSKASSLHAQLSLFLYNARVSRFQVFLRKRDLI